MNVVPSSAQARVLIEKASEDRVALNFALPDSIFGFHTQQAVEKLLKALIAANRAPIPYIHDLRELWTRCVNLGEILPALPWNPLDLQDYAVFLRYQPADDVPQESRDKMREAVDILAAFVLNRAETLNFGE